MITKLGKYTVKSELGKGAMGVVYLGEDPRLGRLVALKTMSPSIANDPELLKRFYREAQSAGKLHHPNIVTIYDIDEADGVPFIAMEFLEGESLEKIVAARKEIPLAKKLDIVLQVCRGLHYAHQHEIVHRDIKCGNIIVQKDGIAKIVDFGIARLMSSATLTRAGMVMGTPMYMAPEQVKGMPTDRRGDVFAVGVILYEILTYKNPFAAPDTAAVLWKIVQTAPDPLPTVLPDCPQGLQEVVQRALEKDRDKRYQSAEEMAFDIEHVASSVQRNAVQSFLDEGRQKFEEGKFDLAKESLQRVLEIDSHHNIARDLLSKAKQQMLLAENQQRAQDLLAQGQGLMESEDYEEALKLFEEALRLDPRQAKGQELKQEALSRRAQKLKVAQHMENATRLLDTGKLGAAVAHLEEALAIDPTHTSARGMLSWVQKEIREKELQKEVRKYLAAAREQSNRKDFDQAFKFLAKARELDAKNVEVESLARIISVEQEKEERRKLLEDRLAKIQQALDQGQLDDGLSLAGKALEEFPGDKRLSEIHAQAARMAEIQKKRRLVEQQLQSAQAFFSKNQYSEAILALRAGLETAPEDVGLTSFLKTVEEAQEVARVDSLRQDAAKQAEAFIRDKKFALAIETIEKVIAQAGDSPQLRDLLKSARSAQEVARVDSLRQDAAKQADAFIRDKKFALAIETIEKVIAQAGDSLQLRDLLKSVRSAQAEHERQERIREAVGRANALLNAKKVDEAIRFLEEAGTRESSEEVSALLASTREQRKLALDRRDKAVEQARKLLAGGEASKALGLLDAVPKEYRENGAFSQVYEQCREGVRRADLLQRAVEDVSRCLDTGELPRGEILLAEAVKALGEDQALVDLEKRLRKEQEKARQAEWRKVLESAKQAVERQEYAKGQELLRGLPQDAGKIPDISSQIKSLNKRIAEAETERQRLLAEQARENAIQKVCAQAQALADSRDFERSLSVIESGLSNYAGETKLLSLKKTVMAGKSAFEREQAIVGAARQIEELIRQDRFGEARQQFQDAVGNFGRNDRMADLEKQLAKLRARVLKQAASRMRKLDQEIRSSADSAKAEGLFKEANQIAEEWSDDERIQALAKGIVKLWADRVIPQRQGESAEATIPFASPASSKQAEPSTPPAAAETIRMAPPVPQVQPPSPVPKMASPVPRAPVRPKERPIAAPRRLQPPMIVGALAVVAVIAAAAIILLRHKSVSPPPAAATTEAVEILTVPEGAMVTVDNQSCTTPGCQLNLAPGNHRVEAQLNGYQTLVKSIDVDAANPQATAKVQLTLEPVPVPKASSTGAASAEAKAPAPGILTVHAGQPDAEVFLNDKRYGVTSSDGTLRIPLEANNFSVRVEKKGFETVPAHHVRILAGRQADVRFNLKQLPQMASLMIRNAVAGADVQVDGQAMGSIQSDGSFSATVSPGSHAIELTKNQYKPVRVRSDFAAGKTVTLNAGPLEQALTPAPPSASPKPAATVADTQSQEWKRISSSTNPRDFEEFRRKYPQGQYAELATRKIEQLEWGSVKSSKDPSALQAYVAKYPDSPYSQEARQRIQALQLAQQSAAERQGVMNALRGYSSAVARGDLSGVLAVWPGLGKREQNSLKEAFKHFQSIKIEFVPTGEPQISGDNAKIACRRTTESTDSQGTHSKQDNVTVELRKTSGGWAIVSMAMQ